MDLTDAAELMGAVAQAVSETDFSTGFATESLRLDHRQDADATGEGPVAGDDVRAVGFTAEDLGIVPAVPGATSSEPPATAMATGDAWGERAGAGAGAGVAERSPGGTAKFAASDDQASYGSRVPVKDAEVAAALGRAGENREQLEQALAAAPGPDMDLLIAKARRYDLVNLKASHLVNTVKLVRQARESVPWSRAIPDPVWTEFVLPYRIADEDLDDWRPEFQSKLQPEIANCRDSKSAVLSIHQWLWKGDEGKAFVKFAVSESRDQSPRQLLNTTKVGRCFELGTNKGLPYLVTASAGGRIGMELLDVREAARVAKELSMNAADSQGQAVASKQPEKVATR